MGFKDLRGAIGWKVEALDLFRGESVVKMDACGSGSDISACLSQQALGVEKLGCWTDLSGERPLTLDMGGSKTVFLLKGRPIREPSSEKTELRILQEDCVGIFGVSEAELLGSWKISRRRVDAIDNKDKTCLGSQDLV